MYPLFKLSVVYNSLYKPRWIYQYLTPSHTITSVIISSTEAEGGLMISA